MTISICRWLVGICVVAVVFSCKQKTVEVKSPATINRRAIDSLIVKGKEFINANADSLPPIAKKLSMEAEASGNAKPLVYSELFNAQYFWLSGNHQKSMELAIKCLTDAENANEKNAFPAIYSLIGNLYKEKFNYQFAFDAQQKGYNWAVANKDTNNIIHLLGLRAMFVHTLKQSVNGPGKDTSINLYLTGLKVAESGPAFERQRISFYDNIAQYYFDNNRDHNKKDYNKAIYYAGKGIALATKYNRQRSLTYGYSWLGLAYYYKGEKQKGLGYLNKALQISRSLKEPLRVMEVYGDLSNCYYFSRDYRRAFIFNKIYHSMNDSLQVHVNEKQNSELQVKYESAKKDKELAMLNNEKKIKNTELIVVLIGSLLGIIFSTLLILQYRIIRRNNKIIKRSNQKKDKALENIAFIQAHELRRPVASVMGIINVIKATDYEFDEEILLQLEKASLELDEKIHAVLAQVENEAN